MKINQKLVIKRDFIVVLSKIWEFNQKNKNIKFQNFL